MLNRLFRSMAMFSIMASVPAVAFADVWLYGHDGLNPRVYPSSARVCSFEGTSIHCRLEGGQKAIVIFSLGHERDCYYEVHNSGIPMIKDHWDVYAMQGFSEIRCRLQYLPAYGNRFNVFPPGK